MNDFIKILQYLRPYRMAAILAPLIMILGVCRGPDPAEADAERGGHRHRLRELRATSSTAAC